VRLSPPNGGDGPTPDVRGDFKDKSFKEKFAESTNVISALTAELELKNSTQEKLKSDLARVSLSLIEREADLAKLNTILLQERVERSFGGEQPPRGKTLERKSSEKLGLSSQLTEKKADTHPPESKGSGNLFDRPPYKVGPENLKVLLKIFKKGTPVHKAQIPEEIALWLLSIGAYAGGNKTNFRLWRNLIEQVSDDNFSPEKLQVVINKNGHVEIPRANYGLWVSFFNSYWKRIVDDFLALNVKAFRANYAAFKQGSRSNTVLEYGIGDQLK